MDLAHLDSLFDQFVKELKYLRNVTPKTLAYYQQAWKAFQMALGERAPANDGLDPSALLVLTKVHLTAFVIALRQRGIKPVSCNTYIKAINTFLVWLKREGHMGQELQIEKLREEQRLIRTLTEQELKAVLAFKPKTFPHWRVYALVCTILDTGCRIDEALSVKVADFDFDNLLMVVYGKGRKERKLPISFELRKTLFRYGQFKERKGLQYELMFPTRKGTKWGQRSALRSYALLLERVGLPTSGFHRLRHTFATQYLKSGGELVRLSKILGHTQITTTMRYLHLLTEDLQGPSQRLSILNRLR